MIKKIEHFNLKHISESGQCFRMNLIAGNEYGLVAYGKYLKLTQVDEEHVEFHCNEEEYKTIWTEYFDLSYDYKKIYMKLQSEDDIFLKEASSFGSGIRILKQEPYEALISFIISQNKNIPAIKSSIEKISKRYGNEIKVEETGEIYYSFPTPSAIAAATHEELRLAGLGYRDDYLIKTSQAIVDGLINLDELVHATHDHAVMELLKLHGVGIKVANCASLYGLHHIDAFPIDTWIKKILKEIYDNKFQVEKYEGYAGIVQQYMFYYMRNRSN